MIVKISNPYKKKDSSLSTRKVVADVGVDDWDMIFAAWPFRGTQDAIISLLFKRFADEVRTYNIPRSYEPASLRLFKELIGGITFPRVSREEPGEHDRGGTPRSVGSRAATHSISPDTQV